MDNKLFFSCFSEDMKSYQLDLEFLHNIDTKESRYAVRPRVVEFKLAKQDGIWWERLLREKSRQHWLRIDFQNWKDEEDIAKGSSLCPLGQAVMGGAFNKDEDDGGNVEGRVLSDGRVVPPTPAQQALHMKNVDIYKWDPNNCPDNSDDKALSDLE